MFRTLRSSAPRRMRAHHDVILLGLRCVKQILSERWEDSETAHTDAAIEETQKLFEAEE